MGLFSSSTKLDTFEDLLIEQLQDIYDAEQRLTKALPKMADAATNSDLKQAFKDHQRETEQQVARLEQCFKLLGKKAKSKTCEAIKGLIDEGEDMIKAKGKDEIRDAALIAAAQRVEHYEMAAYGSARTFAQHLGQSQVANLLQETLDEEGAADKRLTEVAENIVNVRAQHA